MSRTAGGPRSCERRSPFATLVRDVAAALPQLWWIVLATAVLALVGGMLSTARTPVTYLARTSLVVASHGGAPSQDAVLVAGYVAYFNDAAYQQRLADVAPDPPAEAEARTAAASPIMVITASGPDAGRAQANVVAVAQAFRDDVNREHLTRTQAELDLLNGQLARATAPGRSAGSATLSDLRDRIQELQDDQLDVVQTLQTDGGVTVQLPPWRSNVLLGLLGGLLLAAAGTLGVTRLTDRVRTANDVRARVGVETPVELPAGRSRAGSALRDRRLRQLANGVRVRLGGRGVVLVTSPRGAGATGAVAHDLASEWATQGYATVLLRVSTTGWSPEGAAGQSSSVPGVPMPSAAGHEGGDDRPGAGCPVVELGDTVAAGDLAELLELEHLARSLVVLEAPDALGSPVAQAAVLATDATLLVLEPERTSVADAREAVAVLDHPGSPVLHTVLAPVADRGPADAAGHASRSTSPFRSAAATGPGPRTWAGGLPPLVLGTGFLAVVAVVLAGLVVVAPNRFGLLVLLASVALLGVVLGLVHPVLACGYLLLATFLRLAIPSGTLPVDPFLLAFAGVVASTGLRMASRWRHPSALRVDPLVCAIGLYLAWNVVSMVLPHPYPPGAPLDPAPFSVSRFIIIGVAMPMSMFLLGRWIFVHERAVRILLWSLLGAAAYSALVSILQFTVPGLVWPRYILENTFWPGRAVGVFNQPLVNGLVLIVGFLVAVLLASHAEEPPVLRYLAATVVLASVCGIYLTHTRTVWVAFVLVVVLGALVARRFRRGFLLTLAATALGVAVNWSTLTSSDRSAGGVGSVDEVQDRLNTIATSGWAFLQRPFTGWGIGRFAAVNTYHHQQWSPEVPWERGFGIPSHLDALGVLVELGLVGLLLWAAVLVLLYRDLLRATRALPVRTMYGRALGLTALLCLVAQTISGLTVDLRFFDFPNIIVMLLAGAAIGLQRARPRGPAPGGAVVAAPVLSPPRRDPVRLP